MPERSDEPEPELRAAMGHAIANLRPRPADVNAVLEVLGDSTPLPQVLALLGEVHEVANAYVVDCPARHGW